MIGYYISKVKQYISNTFKIDNEKNVRGLSALELTYMRKEKAYENIESKF